jgi:ribose 5-phosphate isomerase
VDGKTAIDLLAQRAVIGLSGTGSTAHVTAINGYRADESNRQYWALYLNGVVSETRANQLVTKTGDQLEWKLAAY